MVSCLVVNAKDILRWLHTYQEFQKQFLSRVSFSIRNRDKSNQVFSHPEIKITIKRKKRKIIIIEKSNFWDLYFCFSREKSILYQKHCLFYSSLSYGYAKEIVIHIASYIKKNVINISIFLCVIHYSELVVFSFNSSFCPSSTHSYFENVRGLDFYWIEGEWGMRNEKSGQWEGNGNIFSYYYFFFFSFLIKN